MESASPGVVPTMLDRSSTPVRHAGRSRIRCRRVMPTRGVIALVTLAAALAGAAPAHAANDRAAARQFGYAAYRARLTILGQKAEIRRRTRALKAPACLNAIREAPGRDQPRAFTVL